MTANMLRKPSVSAAPYWGMLRGLSNPVKLELVVLLSESMEDWGKVATTDTPTPLTEEEKDRLFDSLCGCWADDSEDAARMEAAIKECRDNDVLASAMSLTSMPRFAVH